MTTRNLLITTIASQLLLLLAASLLLAQRGFTLLNGDCDGDNEVTERDVQIVVSAWESTPGSAQWDARADLNGDGKVDFRDLGIVLRRLGLRGTPPFDSKAPRQPMPQSGYKPEVYCIVDLEDWLGSPQKVRVEAQDERDPQGTVYWKEVSSGTLFEIVLPNSGYWQIQYSLVDSEDIHKPKRETKPIQEPLAEALRLAAEAGRRLSAADVFKLPKTPGKPAVAGHSARRATAITACSTPHEWIEMYHLAQKDPRLLINNAYLGDFGPRLSDIDCPVVDLREERRIYAMHLLGDLADEKLIPEINRFLYVDRLRLSLTVERIRLRARGREAYVQAMLEWLDTPKPAQYYPREPYDEYVLKVTEAMRALSVVGAREAVPKLLELAQKPDWKENTHLARALARIGDKRGLPAIEAVLCKQEVMIPEPAFYLEPGEPDPVWVYWQMRTEGMSLKQAIDEIVRSMASDGKDLHQEEVLERIIGPAGWQYLMPYLTKPPDGEYSWLVQSAVIRLLGTWHVRAAVPDLLRLLREEKKNDLRSWAAQALGQIGAVEALRDLVMLAQAEGKTSYLQHCAIRALGQMRHPKATQALLNLLKEHPSPSVRYEVSDALLEAGLKEHLPMMEACLQKETDQSVKTHLAWVIQQISKRSR